MSGGTQAQRDRTLELFAVVALLAVAALVRFVGLPARGVWDADQGHDMLVLLSFVRDGTVPLLGPPTSSGAFHHGALYYYLLAPAAALSDADPGAVVAAIAAAGVGAVLATWWLARAIAGPIAGLVAGGLMALSAAAIGESTFIWNPNLVPLSSALTLAAAWRAWSSGWPGWYVAAAAAQAVTMQCHVLGAVLLVPLALILVADAQRRPPGARVAVARAGLAGLLVIAASYIPLLVHELGGGFTETRAALAFLAAGGDPSASPVLVRLPVIAVRILSWPLTGLVTDAPLAALVVVAGIVSILVWRGRLATGPERPAVRWLALTLGWSAVVLAIVAANLATVVPGLPNDHYHAFLDPVVFVLAGLGAAALWRTGRLPMRVAAGTAIAALIAFNVATWPAAVSPDGGWPAARDAAARIQRAAGGARLDLLGLPGFKSTDAYGFPLTRAGQPMSTPTDLAASPSDALVIICDRLFEPAIGAACGGPAEAAVVASRSAGLTLRDRFDASPRTSISVYTLR